MKEILLLHGKPIRDNRGLWRKIWVDEENYEDIMFIVSNDPLIPYTTVRTKKWYDFRFKRLK